ncbi:type II toxin-antitoxin system VapC family toxin [Xanthobacter autotrophicus DSM 597]|uniref:PIN domain-containing protein n=1 Tax=Xanthobacter wiegelii TaxID=3119913 RepID=UPI00372B9B9E
MIGLDTNVLLRAVADDDPAQSALARDFLMARSVDDPAVVNAVVLAELVWVLRAKYRASRAEIVSILDDLVGNPVFVILHRESVLVALQDYREGIGGFTDVLIAQLNAAAGSPTTMTFDKGAPDQSGFTRLS